MNKLIGVLGTGMIILVGLFGYGIYGFKKQNDVIAQLQTNLQSLEQKISLVEQNTKNKEDEQKKIAKEIDFCDAEAIQKAIERIDKNAQILLEQSPGGFYKDGTVGNYQDVLTAAQFDDYDLNVYKQFNQMCLNEKGIYITGVYDVVE